MGRPNRWTSLVLTVILAVPLTIGCGNAAGPALDDATLTTRVKTAILNDSDLAGLPIDVDTSKGVVTLSGRVKSRTERDKAVALARSVTGVADVTDTLQITP
jgi:hyperosmotically inducible protein